MKTVCPPSNHHNVFVATHALGHMMYGYKLIPMNQRALNKLMKLIYSHNHIVTNRRCPQSGSAALIFQPYQSTPKFYKPTPLTNPRKYAPAQPT